MEERTSSDQPERVEKRCQVEGCNDLTVGIRTTLCRKHRHNKYKQNYKKKKRRAQGVEENQSDSLENQLALEKFQREKKYASMLQQVLVQKQLELLQSPSICNLLRVHQQNVRESKAKEILEKRKAALNSSKHEEEEQKNIVRSEIVSPSASSTPTVKETNESSKQISPPKSASKTAKQGTRQSKPSTKNCKSRSNSSSALSHSDSQKRKAVRSNSTGQHNLTTHSSGNWRSGDVKQGLSYPQQRFTPEQLLQHVTQQLMHQQNHQQHHHQQQHQQKPQLQQQQQQIFNVQTLQAGLLSPNSQHESQQQQRPQQQFYNLQLRPQQAQQQQHQQQSHYQQQQRQQVQQQQLQRQYQQKRMQEQVLQQQQQQLRQQEAQIQAQNSRNNLQQPKQQRLIAHSQQHLPQQQQHIPQQQHHQQHLLQQQHLSQHHKQQQHLIQQQRQQHTPQQHTPQQQQHTSQQQHHTPQQQQQTSQQQQHLKQQLHQQQQHNLQQQKHPLQQHQLQQLQLQQQQHQLQQQRHVQKKQQQPHHHKSNYLQHQQHRQQGSQNTVPTTMNNITSAAQVPGQRLPSVPLVSSLSRITINNSATTVQSLIPSNPQGKSRDPQTLSVSQNRPIAPRAQGNTNRNSGMPVITAILSGPLSQDLLPQAVPNNDRNAAFIETDLNGNLGNTFSLLQFNTEQCQWNGLMSDDDSTSTMQQSSQVEDNVTMNTIDTVVASGMDIMNSWSMNINNIHL